MPTTKPNPRRKGATKSKADDSNLNARMVRRSLRVNVISDALDPEQRLSTADRARRKRLGLPITPGESVSVMVELNLFHPDGIDKARELLVTMCNDLDATHVRPIGHYYVRARLSFKMIEELTRNDIRRARVRAEEAAKRRAKQAAGKPVSSTAPAEDTNLSDDARKERVIYRIWPDFRVQRQVDISAATIKADAARRSFDAAGKDIVWAVLDSGVAQEHPHFQTYGTLKGPVAGLHFDFTQEIDPHDTSLKREHRDRLVQSALDDQMGHGTHVAGIIAGAAIGMSGPGKDPLQIHAASLVAPPSGDTSGASQLALRTVSDPTRLAGIAPRARIVSLKVLGGADDTSSNVIRALNYVRESLNGNGKVMLVHGMNLSLGYEFDPRWFACGQSPICVEVDRLVRSGVVVVIAAGNTGYGTLTSREGDTGAGLTLTINDPGNAQLAITVGATHRESPHTFGVSFFSSKGPTGDGRLKPDLVAPGERITSCAGGQHWKDVLDLCKKENKKFKAGVNFAPYVEDSGTSMAAPHVSGAIAAFLSIRREFIGKPEEIKRIFLSTATSLGRERYFEGAGLLDLMRAIQSI